MVFKDQIQRLDSTEEKIDGLEDKSNKKINQTKQVEMERYKIANKDGIRNT